MLRFLMGIMAASLWIAVLVALGMHARASPGHPFRSIGRFRRLRRILGRQRRGGAEAEEEQEEPLSTDPRSVIELSAEQETRRFSRGSGERESRVIGLTQPLAAPPEKEAATAGAVRPLPAVRPRIIKLTREGEAREPDRSDRDDPEFREISKLLASITSTDPPGAAGLGGWRDREATKPSGSSAAPASGFAPSSPPSPASSPPLSATWSPRRYRRRPLPSEILEDPSPSTLESTEESEPAEAFSEEASSQPNLPQEELVEGSEPTGSPEATPVAGPESPAEGSTWVPAGFQVRTFDGITFVVVDEHGRPKPE